jgi:predicted MFS family arabinose efflux permease
MGNPLHLLYQLFKGAYSGLNRDSWILALVMLVNRVGTMVVPFLSVYLSVEQGLDVAQVGWIMSAFGIGSVIGSWLGGRLTDKMGSFTVQTASLLLSSLCFLVLSILQGFYPLLIGFFTLSIVGDSLRPANAASVALFARSGDVTRAFSLNRMAINLGFSIGPALGGLLAAISYHWLFVADSITCAAAGVFFYSYFRKREKARTESSRTEAPNDPVAADSLQNPYTDWPFVGFVLVVLLYAMVFFQLLVTLPLYYKQVYALNEASIGLLMALNGLVVFTCEMLVVYLVGNKIPARTMIMGGILLNGVSFLLLFFFQGGAILLVSMLVLSFSEIAAMPFMAAVTVQRSTPQNRGNYMGMYTMAYAGAQILGPMLGTQMIRYHGYEALWLVCGGLSLVGVAVFAAIAPSLKKSAQGL